MATTLRIAVLKRLLAAQIFDAAATKTGDRKCLPYCSGFSACRFPSSFFCCCYGIDRGGTDDAE
ncbi:MAG TPA: hypothetical protein VNC39_16510 [Acidocella sp.]|nr:hypothetical protein [Acidocella sp.]